MNEEHKALFVQLIIMLGSSAMQNLGKVVNPATGKTEVSLEGAQAAIDMLDMLQAKTKGNLDHDEERLLRTTLADLKLNYVETASAAPAAAPNPAPATPASEPPKAEEQIESKVRFRKSFG